MPLASPPPLFGSEPRSYHARELVPTDRLSSVRAFTRLFDALAVPENGVGTMPVEEAPGPPGGPSAKQGTAPTTPATGAVAPSDDAGTGGNSLVEMWFLFCLIWGIGGPLDEDGRKKFDAFMREMDTRWAGGRQWRRERREGNGREGKEG